MTEKVFPGKTQKGLPFRDHQQNAQYYNLNISKTGDPAILETVQSKSKTFFKEKKDNVCGSCPALSGAKVTISSPTTPDATCAYTAIATCTPSIALVQFNGASAPLLPSPQTITCDGITSQWSYSNAGVQTPFSTIQCICPQQVCAGFGVGGINFSPSNPGFRLALPDNNCVYTYIAQSCVNPTEMNINFNFNAEILSIPRTIQCTGGEPNAYYFNGANVLTPLMDMFCQP